MMPGIRSRRREFLAMLFSAPLVASAGCSNSGVSSNVASTTEATVHGTVTVRGKPAGEGNVYFNPANIYRKTAPIAEAKIGKDGTYTIKTLLGPNTVSISSPQINNDPKLVGSIVYTEVQSGDNTLDIPLMPPTSGK
jgi:hypothetical protein